MTEYRREKGWILMRAKATGVPWEIAAPIVALFERWSSCNGLEWSISRFKSVKADLVRMKAGMKPCSVWIKKSRSKRTYFGGPLGSLEEWSNRNDVNFGKAVSLLGIYTNFLAGDVTPAQKEKFLVGVSSSKIEIPSEFHRCVLKGLSLARIKPRHLVPAKPLLTYDPSSSKRGPTPFGSRPEEESIIDSLLFLGSAEGVSHLQRYEDLYRPVLLGLENPVTTLQLFQIYDAWKFRDAFTVGSIGFIQEPGFKLRTVANPGRVFQQVLSPLGDDLFGLLREFPWDCTFEQSKADAVISTATFKASCNMFSVDLSSATDNFPLDLQLTVLTKVYPDDSDSISLFRDISRARWNCRLPEEDLRNYGYCDGQVWWTKGQPLGLYPSFASFALTHGLLLLGLLDKEWDHEFFILGDDVVILDEQLYYKYVAALATLGCPTSDAKSLISNHMAEFRSILYLKGERYFQFKWRKVSDDSFLDLMRNTGSRGTHLLTNRQRLVLDRVSPLPENWGGLGWNPKGLSVSQRLDPFLMYFLRDNQGLDRLTSYSGLQSRMLWLSTLAKSSGEMGLLVTPEVTTQAFDQKVISLVQEVLSEFLIPLRELLGHNLDIVLDSNVDLPIPGVRRFNRTTTLQNWEHILASLPAVPCKSDP